MIVMKYFFWVSLIILFYCYAGYGLLLFFYNSIKSGFKKNLHNSDKDLPAVTLVVAAFNERDVLEEKIANTLSIDYPESLLTIIVTTDGSTDGSEIISAKYDRVISLHQPARKGKTAAIKRAMEHVQTPVVVFSDANSMLNASCIRQIVAHYNDPKTGGVAGEKKISNKVAVSPLGEAEGLYWKYESFLKKQDAAFNTIVGAAGELFSIRTALFIPPPDQVICEDFIISMHVCLQGYRVGYEPGAFATEFPSASLKEENKRKVRIAAGACQAAVMLPKSLNIFSYPLLAFQYISRRLLRWLFCPMLLIIFFGASVFISLQTGLNNFYGIALVGQVIFYALALPGWWFIRQRRKAGILAVPFYFVFMNFCLVKGFFLYLRGKHTVLWEKSIRETA